MLSDSYTKIGYYRVKFEVFALLRLYLLEA